MLLRRVALQNVRSFLEKAELQTDGPISILVGPNGGGKTNLLDAITVMLRKHLYATMYPQRQPVGEHTDRWIFQANDALNNMFLERHTAGGELAQLVEVEIEVSESDVKNMTEIVATIDELEEKCRKKYVNIQFDKIRQWSLGDIKAGNRYVYTLQGGVFVPIASDGAIHFRDYLSIFETLSFLREEYGFPALGLPMIYLPTNRAMSGFETSVQLANYNFSDIKRNSDATSSRSSSSLVQLAVGLLAQKFRLLLEEDKGGAKNAFREDESLKEFSRILASLGYEWDLECVDVLKNQYDIKLKKQGTSFLISAASSGERELLTYLFAIYALNVRDAVIIVDEPELHLHPKWQKVMLQMFMTLAKSTGNQFILATHSAAFIAPDSIQFVSRVFSEQQRSQIVRLNSDALPEAKHLLSIVNSQNNERIFFADRVVLVEGQSDRLVFELILDKFGRSTSLARTVEVVEVGGKGLFPSYARLLNACKISYAIIADLDYIEDIGNADVRALFAVDAASIKTDVIENIASLDGTALVARIDEAMQSGNWDDAKELWAYIQSRRSKLKKDLSQAEAKLVSDFISSKYAENIFILGKGPLEAYLPVGNKGKDMAKLIKLVKEGDLWASLSGDAQAELSAIAARVLQP